MAGWKKYFKTSNTQFGSPISGATAISGADRQIGRAHV